MLCLSSTVVSTDETGELLISDVSSIVVTDENSNSAVEKLLDAVGETSGGIRTFWQSSPV